MALCYCQNKLPIALILVHCGSNYALRYSEQQAKKIARQIKDRFGLKIAQAVAGTPVPAQFVAGLIAVEAGKDRKGQISETSTRFEPGVFAKLQQVRDGKRSQWSAIKRQDIQDSPDLALKALATSYGLTQVMGWHCIHNLHCTVGDLRDPEKHLGYAVKLLMLNSADGDFERQEYVGEFREWNSGNEQGKTYDPDYTHNAGLVMYAYAALPDTQTVVEPAPVVATVPAVQTPSPVPVEGGGPSDPPKKVISSLWSRVYGGIAALGGALAAVKGWLNNHDMVLAAGIICLTLIALSLIFRKAILDYLRIQTASDPTKINVK